MVGQPHAHLQQRLLLELAQQTAETVAALARDVEAQRPAVSRAIHALEASGLVELRDGKWALTDMGVQQVDQAALALKKAADQNVGLVERVLERQAKIERSLAGPALHGIAEAAGRPLLDLGAISKAASLSTRMTDLSRAGGFGTAMDAILAERPKFADQVGGMLARLTKSVVPDRILFPAFDKRLFDIPVFDTSRALGITQALAAPAFALDPHPFQNAISAIVDAQRRQLDLVEGLSARAALSFMSELVAANNAASSKIAADFAAITARPLGSDLEKFLQWSAADVTASYGALMKSSIMTAERQVKAQRRAASRRLVTTVERDMMVPTLASASFVGAVRMMTDEEYAENYVSSGMAFSSEGYRLAATDAVLGRVGARFVTMWQGGWHVLESDAPDAVRMAAHQGRELLNQLLAHFAPDSCFMADEIEQHGHDGHPTRKMRARYILGSGSKSNIEWVESVSNALDQTYGFMSADAHLREDESRFTLHEMAMLLSTLGSLVCFLTMRIESRRQR